KHAGKPGGCYEMRKDLFLYYTGAKLNTEYRTPNVECRRSALSRTQVKNYHFCKTIARVLLS
ncbi:MAG TPA: hypothetical protein VJ184_06950, partial [Chryseolinea sp.]|nr:hypothetical protein [Chryseolinea sp.]